jgi:hypothetical protein
MSEELKEKLIEEGKMIYAGHSYGHVAKVDMLTSWENTLVEKITNNILDKLDKGDEWVSVKDKPKGITRYIQLTLLLNNRTVTQGGFDDGRFWIDGCEVFNVTAYQFLPQPPQQSGESV